MNTESATPPIESHPWPPFIPDGAQLLIMGTFPPGAHRWSMDFFYPNPINDFWRIMGLIYFNDKDRLWIPEKKMFNLPEIKQMLQERHIAMGDTGLEIRRLMGNASDKHLEIVTPIPLAKIFAETPSLRALATTGEKAASVVASLTGTTVPKLGAMIETEFAGRAVKIFRMPSTSRAYPMRIDKKAEYYKAMLDRLGL